MAERHFSRSDEQRAVAEALYERECLEAYERGEGDIREGSYVEGVDALKSAVAARRSRVA